MQIVYLRSAYQDIIAINNSYAMNTNIDLRQAGEYLRTAARRSGRATARIMLELYFVLTSPSTSAADRTVILGALAYQILPTDLISVSRRGIFGIVDNAVTLAIAYRKMKRLVTPEIAYRVHGILDQWFGTECEEVVATPAVTR